MAENAPIYDLTLMLSLSAPDNQRAKVLTDVESAIAKSGGSIERNDDWGRRPMAFQINHQAEAEYHLLQFKAAAPMIEELSQTLRITDGVLRFRVIKVRPGTPPAPSSPPPIVVAAQPPSSSAVAASATATAVRVEAEAEADAGSGSVEAAPPAVEAAPPAVEEEAPAAEQAPAAETDAKPDE